jgi:rhamnosyltransferase
VDNGSENLGAIEQGLADSAIGLVPQGRNIGLGAALNIALRLAHEDGFEWLLTLDQDSQADEFFVRGMRHVLEVVAAGQLELGERVAVIAPTHFCPVSNRYTKPTGRYIRDGLSLTNSAMTSGNLLRVGPVLEIGGFREDFFIDWLDHELCLRIRHSGRAILKANSVVLTHSVGHPTMVRSGAKLKCVTNHTPVRRYYLYRNWSWTLRHYRAQMGRAERAVEWRRMRKAIQTTLRYEPNRWAMLRYIVRGLWDGWRDRLGPFDDAARAPAGAR